MAIIAPSVRTESGLRAVKESENPVSATICECSLSYPLHWVPPERFKFHSLYSESAASDALNWIYALNVIPPDKMNEWKTKIKAMNAKTYGGASAVLGNFTSTLLHTKMVLLWLIWDDLVIERIPKNEDEAKLEQEHLRKLKLIFDSSSKPLDANDLYVFTDPYLIGRRETMNNLLHAWSDVVTEIYAMPMATKEFRVRFSNAFFSWIDAALIERTSKLLTTMEERINQRVITIGMTNTAMLLELACGFVVPEFVWKSAEFQRLIYLSGLLVGLVNEMVSLGKDIRHFSELNIGEITTPGITQSATVGNSGSSVYHWPNVILNHYYDAEDESSQLHSFGDSVTLFMKMHDDAVLEFDKCAKEVLKNFDITPLDFGARSSSSWIELLKAYFTNLRYCVYGFCFWHCTTERYMRYSVFDSHCNTLFRFSLQKQPISSIDVMT